MTLVPRYLPGHLNVLEDHLSRRGQILKTEWSLNQTVADRIFRAWGRPFVDLFALGKTQNWQRTSHPFGRRRHGKWTVLSRTGTACTRMRTLLIRACLNKVRTENVEIVLIAPGWLNSGVLPGPFRSRDRLSNNSPTSAETAQADLLTPLSSAFVESQPSRLEVIKGFHKERGFSEAVAQRLAISQRQSSGGFTNLSGRCSESGAMLSRLILSRQLSNS